MFIAHQFLLGCSICGDSGPAPAAASLRTCLWVGCHRRASTGSGMRLLLGSLMEVSSRDLIYGLFWMRMGGYEAGEERYNCVSVS